MSAKASPTSKAVRFQPYDFSSVVSMAPSRQLVQGLLYESALSSLVGPTNSGKTFLALDIGLHISLGRPWFGRQVQQHSVVYIAAEGGVGVQKRLAAFQQHYGLSQNPPFHVVLQAPDLAGGIDADQLIDAIKHIPNLGLVIVDKVSDTLFRRFIVIQYILVAHVIG